MTQVTNATLPAQGQPHVNGNVFYQWPQGMSVQPTPNVHPAIKTPHQAAEYIRKNWDESFLYHQQIALLLLNDYMQPIGILMVPIYHDEVVNLRGMVRSAVLSNAAQVYIAINTLDNGPNLFFTEDQAKLLGWVSTALGYADIGNMGYLFISAWADHFIDPISGFEREFEKRKNKK